ncbi:hypothetical protein [Microcystis phage Mel-JY01]
MQLTHTALVMQPWGLGDILFISPLLKKYWGYDVIVFPVKDVYIWVKDYIKINNVKFIPLSEFSEETVALFTHIFNFVNAQEIVGNGIDCMSAKYKLVNCDIDVWRQISWERNTEKEKSLYYDVLGLTDGDDYILVNNNYANPQLNLSTNITVEDKHKKIITMNYVDGFTLLDWGMVIENAKQFHTVSTSTFYMVEFLDVSKTELHLYPRPNDGDLSPIRPIIDTTKWILHE